MSRRRAPFADFPRPIAPGCSVETLNAHRRALVAKLEENKSKGRGEDDYTVRYLRELIAQADRELLQNEVDRLSQRYRFQGRDLREQLGVDAWTLNALDARKHREAAREGPADELRDKLGGRLLAGREESRRGAQRRETCRAHGQEARPPVIHCRDCEDTTRATRPDAKRAGWSRVYQYAGRVSGLCPQCSPHNRKEPTR